MTAVEELDAPEVGAHRDPDILADFSTEEEVEQKKFKIDGEEYVLLGFAALSDKQEAEATAALARHDKILSALVEANEAAGPKIAEKLRGSRIKVISLLTTCPPGVVKQLNPAQQGELLQTVVRESGGSSGTDPDL